QSAAQQDSLSHTTGGSEDVIPVHSTRERHTSEQSTTTDMSTRPRDRVPFAAELEVINQRSRGAGPSRRAPTPEPDSRRRDISDCEREAQHTLAYHADRRMHNSGTYHNTLPEPQRPKLATFDGNEDWDSFLMPFERQARKHGWSAIERVDRLHECLRGAAVRYVCSLPERTREDYVLLVEQLTQRFGKRDPPTTIRRKIGELRQARESSAEFAEEVRRLITLAYPGVDLQLQDQLATDAFLKGLQNQKMAYEVMNRDPGSFVEAQKFVEAHEHNFKATVGRDTEIKNRARRISWVDEGDLCEDTATMSRRVQTPQYVTADQFATLMDQVKALVNTVGNLKLQVENLQSINTGPHQPKAAQSSIPERKQTYQQAQPSRGRSQTPSPNRGAAGSCFKCGETGHFRRDCARPLSPVAARNDGEKHIGYRLQSDGAPNSDHQLQGRQIGCTKKRGESLQIPMTINGIQTQAIADTGAQTTVISEELYQSILKRDTTTADLHQTYLLNAGVGDGMQAKHGLTVTFGIGSKSINWEVHVAPIRDSVLLGLDLMKAHDVVIYTRGKVFIGGERVPSRIVQDDGSGYCVARVTLGETTIIPATSECVVWGEVDDPRPGVTAVLEPLNITDSVASGSVVVTMEKMVPIRVCNVSSKRMALPKGACLGVLIEAYPEPPGQPKQSAVPNHTVDDAHSLMVGRIATACDIPEHLQNLVATTSEALSEEQQQRFTQLLLTYQSIFAKNDSDLGHMSTVTHKIDTGLAKPVRQPVRRTPLGFQDPVEERLSGEQGSRDEDIEPKGPGKPSQSKRPECQSGRRRGHADSSEKTVKTSRGRLVNLPERIQVNDLIVEVDGTSLVGVTQSFAATVLRNTSGTVRFIIGREKPGEQSEVAQLIQQTLEQERWQREMMEQRYRNYMGDEEEPGDYGSDEDEEDEMSPSYPNAIEVFDLAENEDTLSPVEVDPEKLTHKYKELQIKHAVTQAEIQQLKRKSQMIVCVQLHHAEQEKQRWRCEKAQMERSMQENRERMEKLEGYWMEAQSLCQAVDEHLKETQAQYQALERKYSKAKRLIKEYQQK
ncbi:hypothetical protein DNTS_024559, partial [Danionella cerebrum]